MGCICGISSLSRTLAFIEIILVHSDLSDLEMIHTTGDRHFIAFKQRHCQQIVNDDFEGR